MTVLSIYLVTALLVSNLVQFTHTNNNVYALDDKNPLTMYASTPDGFSNDNLQTNKK